MLLEHQIICEMNTHERKPEQPSDTPTAKKPRVGDQIGEGEVEKPLGDDDSYQSTSTFEDYLKKIELIPRKEQKHCMSRFLRGKTKPVINRLSKELKENWGLKWFISVKVGFVKPRPDGVDLIVEPHFRSLCMTTVNCHELEGQL